MLRISLLIWIAALSALERDWCCSAAVATLSATTAATRLVGRHRSWPGEVSAPGASMDRHRIQSHHKLLPFSASALARLRGGASDVETEGHQQDVSLVAVALRSVVRFLLSLIELISPNATSSVRSFIESAQTVLGLDLLPKQHKGKASKRRSKKQSAKTAKEASAGADKHIKGKQKPEKLKAGSVKPTATAKAPPKAKAQSKKACSKTNALTQEHLRSTIKTSSPNYRIQRELKQFIKEPPPNLTVKVGKNIRVWIVTMKGGEGSIYEGETFQLRIQFPPQYPTVPPSVYFLPPHIPLHEHVYTNGDICLSLLGKDWRPTMTAQSIAVSIQSILNSAIRKELPMDNAHHAHNKPGQFQKDWVYHDDNC